MHALTHTHLYARMQSRASERANKGVGDPLLETSLRRDTRPELFFQRASGGR